MAKRDKPSKTVKKVFKLHKIQHEFHHCTALRRAFMGGIGSGKSWVGAYDLLKRAMAPESSGKMFMVVAPTHVLMKDATQRTLLQIADEMGIIKQRFKQPPELILNNDATIIFRSGEEPDRLRGPNITGIWLDEASIMDEEVWKICLGRLREGGTAGWITATFTPQGMNHWTYNTFGLNTDPDTKFFRCKTKQNPFLNDKFVGMMEKSYDAKTAMQELEGEFISMDGTEWPNEYFPDGMWVDSFPPDHDIRARSMFLDPSKGKNSKHGDYAATIELARDYHGILYCNAYLERLNSEELTEKFVNRVSDFCPDAIGVEVNQFQHLLAIEISKKMKKIHIDIPITELYNNISKEVRIRRLGPYLSNHQIRFVRSEGSRLLVSQLREFPLGKHDDGPDGLEGALRVLIRWWNNRLQKVSKGIRA